MVSSARYLVANGAPVHAIGIQSHFQGNVDPNLLNVSIGILCPNLSEGVCISRSDFVQGLSWCIQNMDL